MANGGIRRELDALVSETISYNQNLIPPNLISDINKWKWGSYGWISPVSLLITAAWRKFYYPESDCCKIWAVDEQGQSIPGGYSIRSEDEGITIPIFAKYDLCNGFCSDNSGMQGSRAIEKMRSLKRLGDDFATTQRTIFDLKLFAHILNQIDSLRKEQALEVIKLFIIIANQIREKRLSDNLALLVPTAAKIDVLNFLNSVADPELTKCVAAACLQIICDPHKLVLVGVSDYKTAADARAKKPGDLALLKMDIPVIAAEVKDNTQQLDWQNIERALKILVNNPSLSSFLFIMEDRSAITTDLIKEMTSSNIFSNEIGRKISFIALHDLLQLTKAFSNESEIVSKVSEFLSIAPAVKPETKARWLKLIAT